MFLIDCVVAGTQWGYYKRQKSLPHLLQCHCLLLRGILNNPIMAAPTALDTLEIFDVSVLWQYGHSTVRNCYFPTPLLQLYYKFKIALTLVRTYVSI